MSHYTTELRYICEELAGETESKGLTDVASIISRAKPKIFDFDYPYYNAETKDHLEESILRHFYTKEIGFETYALWKLHLESEMRLIMPRYVGLYKTLDLEYNPLQDIDYYRDIDGTDTESRVDTERTENNKDATITDVKDRDEVLDKNTSGLSVSNGTNSRSATGSESNAYSDTPQGGLSDVANNRYLTDYRLIGTSDSENGTNTNRTETSGEEDSTKNIDETDTRTIDSNDLRVGTKNRNGSLVKDYTEHTHGKKGTKSYQEMILEYRKTLLNIEALICADLEDLFMGLW